MFEITEIKHTILMSVLKFGAKFVSITRPDMFVGAGSSLVLCDFIASKDYQRLLLITDKGLSELGLHEECQSKLESMGINVTVYDDVSPNPTCHQIDSGVAVARSTEADVILAFGGGSPIDAAKIIAASVTNHKSVAQMVGLFKIRKKPLPLYAIPTTAGTGSEVTPAAVISIPEEERKCSIGDPKLVPIASSLDPKLMLGLPPAITAATGMDVLTHAIEAYVSTFSTEELDERCVYAVKTVFRMLPRAYNDGKDEEARTAMALASYQGGVVISEAGVGYVHAIAHKVGGKYGVPHGLANAIILPHVLRYSKDAIDEKLCNLAQAIGLPRSADGFIDAIEELSESLGIPTSIKDLQAQDIEEIFAGAQQEAMSLFPVPKYMPKPDGEALVRALLA